MNQRTYCLVTGIIFTAVAVLHGARLIRHWEAVIGGWSMPSWISVVALVVAGFLAWTASRLRRGAL